MSDNDDDFMCDDDEDYGLVRITQWAYILALFLMPGICMGIGICNVGILRRQQLGAGRRSWESILQQQGAEGGGTKAALASFQKVLDLENGEKGEWGFKALKQMIKINFRLVSESLKNL